MKVLKTSIGEVDEDIVHEAINVMADGGVILYPTDTVYGLGANIFDKNAVRKVFDIKQRSYLKPLQYLWVTSGQLTWLQRHPLAKSKPSISIFRDHTPSS